MVGLHLLKHARGVSDDLVCAQWKSTMRRLNAPRLHARRNRFDALAIARKNETCALGTEWRRPIYVSKNARDLLDIRSKSRFTR
jgi:hypothetical protein